MNQVQNEGFYRAQITEFGLKEMESGAIAISIKAKLLEAFQEEDWVQWDHYDQEAEGDIWIVGKAGKCNAGAVESLAKYAGWDGDMESIVNGTWQPSPCQVQVKREEYKGVARLKIAFVNDYNRTPRAMGNVTSTRAGELKEKFGSDLRGIASKFASNHQAAAPVRAKAYSDEDIPF